MSSQLEVGRGGGNRTGRQAGRRAVAKRAAGAALAVLAVTAPTVLPAAAAPACGSARCATGVSVTADAGAYATPLVALGGRTLAQYLAAHRTGQVQGR